MGDADHQEVPSKGPSFVRALGLYTFLTQWPWPNIGPKEALGHP